MPTGSQGQDDNAPDRGGGLPLPRWQSEEQDLDLRCHIVENILRILCIRIPDYVAAPEWQHRLARFVHQTEETLYQDAPSKDDYADLTTLELRLVIYMAWCLRLVILEMGSSEESLQLEQRLQSELGLEPIGEPTEPASPLLEPSEQRQQSTAASEVQSPVDSFSNHSLDSTASP